MRKLYEMGCNAELIDETWPAQFPPPLAARRLGAMICHDRPESEHAKLQEVLEQSMQNEELRQEVVEMGKSMADVLMDRGEQKGRTEGRTEAAVETRQQTLFRLLSRRFGNVPRGVVRAVESTTDVHRRLDDWLDRLVTASKLDEREIPVANGDGQLASDHIGWAFQPDVRTADKR